MPPIPTFAEWSEKVRNRKWSRPEDRYFDYVRRVLFAPRRYPDFYSEEQAKQDFFSDLQSVLDQSAEKLRDRLAKKQPIPKGGQVRGKTDSGKTDAGKTDSGGSENPTGKGDQRKSGGSGNKSFSVEQSVKQEGNQIQAKKEKPEPFDNKTEFGNIELQSVFVRMAKNPDLSLKSDAEKELPDDRHQWGIVRPARVMNVAKDNITEWNSAHPGSVWLGFVRIGRRVDRDEDKLALMQLVETLDGRKFAIPRKELRAGEPWHQVWLDQKFDAQKDPKIKVWNGWTLDALKKDKELRMSETGCFYGFFLVKATEKNPDSLDTWISLGRLWGRKARRTKDPGFWLNADACAKIVFEREPKNRLARSLAGLVLLEQHAFADAKDVADQLLLEDHDDLEALGLKSDAALELGNFGDAADAAQKLVDLKPSLPSYARAAHLRWLQGDADAAKSIYRAAFDARDPRDPEPYAWVLTEAALIFWHQGDIEGADKGFDKALQVFSDEPSALLGKARVALAQGDPKGAITFASRARAHTQACEAAWVLGDAHARAGDERNAQEAYQQLIDCGRKTDKRTLAAFFATKNRDLDDALALATEEAKVRRDMHTRDVLAWASYRKGRLDEALKESDAALAHGTKEALLHYHAGAIRLARGDKKEGEKMIRAALAMNPQFEPTASIEAKKLLGEAP